MSTGRVPSSESGDTSHILPGGKPVVPGAGAPLSKPGAKTTPHAKVAAEVLSQPQDAKTTRIPRPVSPSYQPSERLKSATKVIKPKTPTLPALPAHAKGRDSFQILGPEVYERREKQLHDFRQELIDILGQSPTTLEICRFIEEELAANRKLLELAQKQSSGGKVEPSELASSLRAIESAHKRIQEKLNPFQAKAESAVRGSQVLRTLFKAKKREALLATSSHVTSVFKDFHEKMSKAIKEQIQAAKGSTEGIRFLTPEQRKAVYGNVVYLKERVRDVHAKELQPLLKQHERVDKEAKKIFKKISTTAEESKKKALEKQYRAAEKALKSSSEQIEAVGKKYESLATLIEQYYKQLGFTDDDYASEEFRDLSLEARRPTRNLFMMYANDLVAGAKNLAKEKEALLLADLKGLLSGKEGVDTLKGLVDSPPPIQWDLIRDALSKSWHQPLLNFFLEKDDSIKNLINFNALIKKQEQEIYNNPHIGNGNPKEKLPIEKDKWKKCQEEAEDAIGKVADALKEGFSALAGVSGKGAGKAITGARDAVINSRERWSEPIDRTVDLPVGDLPSHRGKLFFQFNHFMECPNSGYASSSYRGRDPDSDPTIQPNWWKVRISGGASWSRSATQVEFFSKKPALRAKATERQALEVLSGKALDRVQDGPPGSLEHPLLVPVTDVSLLSPDALRGRIAEKDALSHLVKDKTGVVADLSTDERSMLDVSHNAWMSFDWKNINKEGRTWKDGEEFSFTDSQKQLRKVVVHVTGDGESQKVVFEIKSGEAGQEKSIFVQFDVVYYNTGCNQMTKLMAEVASKEQLQEKAAAVVEKAVKQLKKLGLKKQAAKTLYGVDLPGALKVLNDTKLDPTTRLLTVFSSLLPQLLSSKLGKERLAKLGVTLTDEQFAELAKLDLSRLKKALQAKDKDHAEMLLASLGILKTVLTNPNGQALINALLKSEKLKEFLGDIAIQIAPQEFEALAGAIPSEEKIKKILNKEKVGIEDLANLGFPLIRALIDNPMGQGLLQAAVKMKKGEKEVTAADVEVLREELPKELEIKEGEERGNIHENTMNKRAFARHSERVDTRLEVIKKELAACELQIEKADEKKNIEGIKNQITAIQRLREALLQAERNYKEDKSDKNLEAKKEAFKTWQAARKNLAIDLDKYTKLPAEGQSDAFTKYMESVVYEQDLLDLRNDVSDILEFQAHRQGEFMDKNMFILPSRLMALSIKLDEAPHFGCRSGKDRTTLVDVEVSVLFAMREIRGRFLNYRELEDDPLTEDVREQILLNSGQIDDLAYKNIGSIGINVSGGHGNYLGGVTLGSFLEWQHSLVGGGYAAFARSF